jgi:DNA modification methylase
VESEIALVDKRTGELQPLPGDLMATSLVLPENLTFDEWSAVGAGLDRMAKAVMWWVGDWWRYGEHAYGERAAQALQSDGYSFQTFMDAGWVASTFETSRRREVLSWTHHREVAALSRESAKAADGLLDLAEQNKWSTRDLRQQVKALRRQAKSLEIASRAGSAPQSLVGVTVRNDDCETLIASLPDGSVSLLLTDPPYAVTDNDWDTWESEADYWEFMKTWLAAMRPKMADDFSAFVFCDADASPRLYHTMLETGWPVLRQAIWHRPNLAKKRAGSITFLSAYEPFWHAGTRGLNLPDEWGEERFDVQRFVVPQSTHVEDTAYHPTQKPLDLFRRLVSLGSQPGELVVDPFCGAGTTPVACKAEGRHCLAGDQSDEYVRIALGRLA